MTSSHKKGFTLIELLITISAIAVLSTVVILALNPAELLRRARDARRISDLNTLEAALKLYLADIKNPNLASGPFGYGGCYLSTIGSNVTTAANCGVFALSYTNVASTAALYRRTDAAGWLPVNLASISSGAPFAVLPIDPMNDLNYYFAYAAASAPALAFEIDAMMESVKYSAGGPRDVERTDGGDNDNAYEVGMKLTL